MKIEAHHPCWALDRGDYGWLTPARHARADTGLVFDAPTLHRWCDTTQTRLNEVGGAHLAGIMGGNAIQTYQLKMAR